jgi:hypothetical protein
LRELGWVILAGISHDAMIASTRTSATLRRRG